MKKYEVHVFKKSCGFGSAKDELAEEVEQFLNQKAGLGYETVSISFTYYQATELVAFVTISN
ncbi:hypothetical protein [Flavobacterium pedocola]